MMTTSQALHIATRFVMAKNSFIIWKFHANFSYVFSRMTIACQWKTVGIHWLEAFLTWTSAEMAAGKLPENDNRVFQSFNP